MVTADAEPPLPPTAALDGVSRWPGWTASASVTNVTNFATFMANRAAVEQFRSQVQLYVGRVQGWDPAGTFGLTRPHSDRS